jgi:hypothetical protein
MNLYNLPLYRATHFYRKAGDNGFLRNFDNHQPDYTVSQSGTSHYKNLPRINIEIKNEAFVNPENIEKIE